MSGVKTYTEEQFVCSAIHERENQKFGLTPEGEMAIRVLNSVTIDGPLEVIVSELDTCIIRNVSLTANTELAVSITAGTKRFRIKCRGNAKYKLRTTSGGDYMSIGRGWIWEEDMLNLESGATYYIEANKDDTLEIKEWS